ncbi:hypothetical protein [Vibrio cidicii]|uniref:hypothetical protein n=1 Tax=Vibrio cidicii TaxID=1763883 RepID=UPI0018C1EE06|nr:hypothetical protein [Vibrio cidicii]MBG0755821.1 hypothetical protein [Vibrio cidicii]
MSFKVFLLNLLLLVFLAGCTEAKVEKVVIYSGDGKLNITDQKQLQAVTETISGLTMNIDDVFQVILTPSQISEIINNEYGIEIQYSHTQKVYRVNNNHPISFNKIYIPFSGKYSKFGVVYFFGDDEGYGGLPPYVTKEGLHELKRLVQNMEK